MAIPCLHQIMALQRQHGGKNFKKRKTLEDDDFRDEKKIKFHTGTSEINESCAKKHVENTKEDLVSQNQSINMNCTDLVDTVTQNGFSCGSSVDSVVQNGLNPMDGIMSNSLDIGSVPDSKVPWIWH